MDRVVVTGAAGALGRRVLAVLDRDPSVRQVVAIDLVEPPGLDLLMGVGFHAADVATADLTSLFAGAGAVVHLAATTGEHLGEQRAAEVNLAGLRHVLGAAGGEGVTHVVAVSSAAVYGAWATNPVPLTEAAPVRPSPGFGYAAEKAELERLCCEWRAAVPGRTASLLRPAPVVAEDEQTGLARSLIAALPFRTGPDQPPLQFVHADDLAAAVALACRERIDGPVNVAPEGWIEPERVRALAGAPPRLPVPLRFATWVAAWTWRLRVGSTPPGLVQYTTHPWVVANDRMVAAGWRAEWSNEEAFVAAHPGTWWSRLSPARRQEAALGAAGGLLALGVAAISAATIRGRRGARRGGR